MFTRDRVYPIQPLAKLDDVCLKSPSLPTLAVLLEQTSIPSRLKILL